MLGGMVEHDDGRLGRILASLRTEGGRVTVSRRLIVTALLSSPHHVTAEELIDTVRADHPEIAPSTVYRTLHSLAELGVVRHVHVGHGPAVYHLADDTHSHLVCHGCGVVIEVPPDLLAAPARRVLRDHGFTLDTGHVALSGHCASCASPPQPPPDPDPVNSWLLSNHEFTGSGWWRRSTRSGCSDPGDSERGQLLGQADEREERVAAPRPARSSTVRIVQRSGRRSGSSSSSQAIGTDTGAPGAGAGAERARRGSC